jgi:hypothetical protein
LALFVILPASLVFAEHAAPSKLPFAISPSKEWMELPLPLQGVLASYGKKGTLATFHITEREFDEVKNLEQLRWEDLFSPQFSSIDIHKQGSMVLGGERSRFCIYTLKAGEFKDTMEGKLAGKYINYVLIHGGKLFSITFKDTEDGFALNYPSFLTAIRTLRFNAPAPISPRRRS